MPINPITLDKMEPVIIKQVENKVVDRIVHEIKGAENGKEEKHNSSFNGENQKKSAEQFSRILSSYNMRLDYKVLKRRIKIKIMDKSGNIIIETEVDDMDVLLKNIEKSTGSIIDLKG